MLSLEGKAVALRGCHVGFDRYHNDENLHALSIFGSTYHAGKVGSSSLMAA